MVVQADEAVNTAERVAREGTRIIEVAESGTLARVLLVGRRS